MDWIVGAGKHAANALIHISTDIARGLRVRPSYTGLPVVQLTHKNLYRRTQNESSCPNSLSSRRAHNFGHWISNA